MDLMVTPMYNRLRDYWTVLQSLLHSHQQYIRVLCFFTHLLIFLIPWLIYYGPYSGYKMVSPWDFNLHFSSDL